MILNNAPQAEAVLSNVGEIGEFRIRNSAKAFNILSSGLYANKVKAIIRELSCNAIDSHTAAGSKEPFEVHLPTSLEPWFAIRDFGTGLSHDQVTKIYTTYFESTKTASNEFIGALGLGSKSPFSYTDNFTVTAIQNGRKGIYSAFINNEGVPSIALMNDEQVTEPNGVEVKFSVNDRYDFSKFADEANSVYRWFPVLPTITGNVISIHRPTYESENIIAGVHSLGDSKRSLALMGNIAYPIDVPQKESALEGLHHLLACGLVMEFGIGELDFQASREGLSYIPLTIDSIRKKLVQINAALTAVFTKEADAIECEWTRSQFLYDKKKTDLWRAAVAEYVTNTNFDLYDTERWSSEYSFEVDEAELVALNISLTGFTASRNQRAQPALKYSTRYRDGVDANGVNQRVAYQSIEISAKSITKFIENDTKVGALSRAKYHYRENVVESYREDFYVLNKIDKKKSMDLAAFYKMLHNPPTNQRILASTLDEKQRAATKGFGKNVNILHLEKRGGASNRSNSAELVWRASTTLDNFDKTQTYYYIPLIAFQPQFDSMHVNTVHDLASMLYNTKMPEFQHRVYGVRKGDMETIKKLPNWVNLESHIKNTLVGMNAKICMASVMERLDNHKIFDYNYQQVVDGVDAKSPAKAFLDNFVGLPKLEGIHWLQRLMRACSITNTIDVDGLTTTNNQELKKFASRYPLISKFSHYANEDDVCEYVKLIDAVKGI
jgi:hypothetical protein